ncbi:MAG: hypothetical protein R3Y24_11495 [Eubacteriales bacterium]
MKYSGIVLVGEKFKRREERANRISIKKTKKFLEGICQLQEFLGKLQDEEWMIFYISDLGESVNEMKSEFADIVTYWLVDKNEENTIYLIEKLWEIRNTGGGLSRSIIEKMIQCDVLFKNGNLKCVSNSSYDLLVGDEYYYAGNVGVLTDKSPFIAIEPYDYVLASCQEVIALPRDIVGRFDVSVNLFCQGVILSNSTQVDPGFHGKLFCLLFNTSNKVVYLKRGTHYATIEFNKLIEPTTAYGGKYNYKNSIVEYLPSNVMQGAINELKKEMEELKMETKKMQNLYLSVMTIFVAIISIFVALK